MFRVVTDPKKMEMWKIFRQFSRKMNLLQVLTIPHVGLLYKSGKPKVFSKRYSWLQIQMTVNKFIMKQNLIDFFNILNFLAFGRSVTILDAPLISVYHCWMQEHNKLQMQIKVTPL